MRIGCCCNIEDAPIALAAGYDFIECKVTSLLPDENEEDEGVVQAVAAHRASPLPVAAFNVFLPRDLKIVGPLLDQERIDYYVEAALTRVHAVGAEIVVFGSGAARAIPEGFSPQEARRQTISFLHRVADAAERNNVIVVIEPLNRKESNTILSVAEGVELARAVNRPSIKVLADFYHMDEEVEPLSHLTQYSEWIKHIHVADSDRGAPGTGQYPYAEFAERLRRAGYDGMVSIECRWRDFASEAKPALEFLRRTLG
jgi:sugar phosphate isomerase/epimerase